MKARNAVVWFEIYVDDINRARKFYEKVLDIKLKTMSIPGNADSLEMMAFPMGIDREGAPGALVKMDDFKAGGNSTIVYFGSEDCAIEEKRINEAGGKVVQAKQDIGEHGFICLALDSEGNTFGIHSEV